jgi:hypothetical protein
MYETELRTFRLLWPTLVKKYRGLWALLKGDHFENAYDTYAEALKAATSLYGTSGYLIKQILEKEAVETGIPS